MLCLLYDWYYVISSKRFLRHFFLKKDCNLTILRSLVLLLLCSLSLLLQVEASGPLLLLLDVEDSKNLGEEAVPLLAQCTTLEVP